MPQLDTVTFFSQVFWLFLTFFSLYLGLLHYILPEVGRILKIRKRTINKLLSNDSFKNESFSILNEHDVVLEEGVKVTENFVLNIFNEIKEFDSLEKVYYTFSNEFNELYNDTYKKELCSIFIKKYLLSLEANEQN